MAKAAAAEKPAEPIFLDQESPVGPGIEAVDASARKLPVPLIVGAGAVLLVLLVVIVFAGKMLFTDPVATPVPTSIETPGAGVPGGGEGPVIAEAWQREVLAVLDGFTKARSVKDKLPFVLGGATMEAKMNAFYSTVPDDTDTPTDAFAFIPPPEADLQRGIYSMTYDQPPQLDIREFFRPLATLEVQYRLVGADMLLAAFGDSTNFAIEPLKVFAVFKRTPDGVKLDWETFIQTKHRLFRKFASLPAAGERAVFRLSVAKQLERDETSPPSSTLFMIFDPSQPGETLQVYVPTGSELENTLSERLKGPEGSKFSLTAPVTLEMEWTADERPAIRISRFICWEFLDVGGTAAVPAE